MEPLCIVVLSSMGIIIFGQIGQRIYQKYFERDRTDILAEYDPSTEMGPLLPRSEDLSNN
jgi:hypothetical protein